MAKITKELVAGWIKDMGLSPTPTPDPSGHWRYSVSIPPNQGERHLEVFGMTSMPRALIIGAKTVISPEHRAVLVALDADAKREFHAALIKSLDREFIEYNIEHDTLSQDVLSFVVQAARFDDGLTLDSFARSVNSVYKAQIGGIQCVQQHLGGSTPQGGEFAFRKLGMQ
jgi:hypothetical protein